MAQNWLTCAAKLAERECSFEQQFDCYNSNKGQQFGTTFMIVNKQVLSQSTLFQWITNNQFAYQSTSHADLTCNTFSSVLKSMRKYLHAKFKHSSELAIRIEGLGVICQSVAIKKSKLDPNIQFHPSAKVLAMFGMKNNQPINSGALVQEMDMTVIAGQVFSTEKVANWVISSYIHASLEHCLMEPDRPVKINLGPLLLSILHKKLSIVLRSAKPIKPEKGWMRKLEQKKFHEKSLNDSQVWRDNIMGTLQERLNIRRVIKNLNKGAALSLKQSANSTR